MVSATGVLRSEGFRYALDNGAWTAYQQGRPFDAKKFRKAVKKLGAGADFIVIPDLVAQGRCSLAFSESWLSELEGVCPLLLLAVQDGMEPGDIDPLLGREVGIFLGGTTAWKLETARLWGVTARTSGCYYHVGRVNSAKRIALCAAVGAHSFDGTSATRFAKTLPRLDGARRQLALWNNE